MNYPRFRYGYKDAVNKDGFHIMQTNFKGEKKPVKVWGKILIPTFYFHCRYCGKTLRGVSKQGLLVDGLLFCIDCFSSGKYKLVEELKDTEAGE